MDVVAIGDNISDCYQSVGRVFPGGNAVNVAVGAAQAGGTSAYIGAVGDDARGRLLIDALAAESVDTRRVRVLPGTTACCDITHAGGERLFGTTRRGVALFKPAADDFALAATAGIIHTTYCSGMEEFLPELAALGPVSFDFSGRIGDGYADDLLPHVHMAEFSAAHLNDEEAAGLLRWAAGRGPRYVLATRGARGAMLIDGERITAAPAAASAVTDTLGAGDSFIGRALYGLVHREPAAVFMAAATIAAARTCRTWGAFGHGASLLSCCGGHAGAADATQPARSQFETNHREKEWGEEHA
jgi:fructoselysine 6-kinase